MKLLAIAVLIAFISHSVLSKVISSREWKDEIFQDGTNDRPILAKRGGQGHCSATGDPHYKTFDGKYYNFMGTCRYVMATDACNFGSKKASFGSFKVIQENVACGAVSCTNSVEVIIQGESIHLSRGTSSPAPKETTKYSVQVEGPYVVVRSKQPAGLTVKWDRSMGLYIDLDQSYGGKVCGLCGNFDGNNQNDFIQSQNGATTTDANVFGHSWQTGGKCGIPVTPMHPCETHADRRDTAIKDCSVITSDDHFKTCKGALDLVELYNNCLYDACAGTTVTMKDSSCEAIKTASTQCKEKTGEPVTWGHLEQKCSGTGSSDCQRSANINGNQRCCHFPFENSGVWFYDCVPQVTPGKKPWCSDRSKASWKTVGECL